MTNPDAEQPPPLNDQALLKSQPATGYIADSPFIGPIPTDQQLVAQQIETFHSGPLPPPEVLAGYEEVLKGLADRMVKMAEKEQDFRHGHDSKLLSATVADAVAERRQIRWGQTCGLIVCVVALLSGVCMAVWGQAAGSGVAGGAVSVASLVALVSAFIWGPKPEGQKAEKAKARTKKGDALTDPKPTEDAIEKSPQK